MAKERGIAGWHGMRKAELVEALLHDHKSGGKRDTSEKVVDKKRPGVKTKHRPTAAQRRIQAAQAQRDRQKDLGSHTDGESRDRLVLMVRDPYWLQATWEISGRSIERAKAALAEFWHTARPVLRVIEIPAVAEAKRAEIVSRVIEVHGGVNKWYIDVQNPPSNYRVEIGYLATTGHFQTLARSNVVTTPQPGSTEILESPDGDVVENSERIFAMSGGYNGHSSHGELREFLEERLHRSLGAPIGSRFGNGAEGVLERKQNLEFTIDAEMIVYGCTVPDAFVTMGGEPVTLNPDGSFTARLSLPDRRQVLPIVASSRDGVEEQTIVLAVERNTKVMERKVREPA
jgi:hypothetical protein